MNHRNSIAREIARELRHGNKLKKESKGGHWDGAEFRPLPKITRGYFDKEAGVVRSGSRPDSGKDPK